MTTSFRHLHPIREENGRFYFSGEKEEYPLPDLIEVQVDSYRRFLEEDLKELFDEVSPIQDFTKNVLSLSFLDYSLGEPKYAKMEAKTKGLTYEAPLNVKVQLVNKETGEIKEQEIFFGGIPLMTEQGTFIVNGIERVVLNQIHRSPGVFFSESPTVPGFFNAKIIPDRGAWLEIETDRNGVISVKIDRKRKIYLTTLLRAFGYSTDKEIMELFKDINTDVTKDYIMLTLEKDPASNVEEGLQQVYRKIRPGDLATPESAKQLLSTMFFDYRRYDMGKVGRYKLNKKLGKNMPNNRKYRVFQLEDFVDVVKLLIRMNNGEMQGDDIDNLANRRVRSVGELVKGRFRIGLLRLERICRDRMTILDLETVTPQQLINAHPVSAAMKEFFASSQLSQFMDQVNPLAELGHKRRMSAMGPGGLSRERASFDVRDVHATHYGRICPIQTPEGPNIGLVVSLATYAKVDEYGFLQAPYRKVAQAVKPTIKDMKGRITGSDIKHPKSGKIIVPSRTVIDDKIAHQIQKLNLAEVPVRSYVTEEVAYYDAEEEQDLVIAQANASVDEKGQFVDEYIAARHQGNPSSMHFKDITHIDVSPKQIVSVSTSLIPFLEHDDGNRALMGSNMQRQAVSLVRPAAPLVGTGMEARAAYNSGQVIFANSNGTVASVTADEIKIITSRGKEETYPLQTFLRSNQTTLIHQRPLVFKGDRVKKEQAIAEGAAIEGNELALGQNLLVAYMPWHGYNYEDAIILSENVVRWGLYDSVHIEEFSTDVRETKLGPEIITRDIPNVGEDRLKNLDEDGVIRIGAEVNEGDILVGKITPKGETELTPEERLLRAIFGDKAHDVKDTSLKLPGGQQGKVIHVQFFTRKDGAELPTGVSRRVTVSVAQTKKVQVGDKMAGRHGNKGVISTIVPVENMPHLEDGTPVDIVLNPLGVISRMNIGQILETHVGWAAKRLGIKIATPVLNGISDEQIRAFLREANLPEDGRVQLYDGFTGEPFVEKTTVGYTYMLKLEHLVDNKIHARSVGPYSLVTQQPLGGKAQHGGQRFGEMEVWALEAYAACHVLQEMLTVKSDDVYGRGKAYEAITKGDDIYKPNIPASFNVLVKELQSCGLDVELLDLDARGHLREVEIETDEEKEEEAIAGHEDVMVDDGDDEK